MRPGHWQENECTEDSRILTLLVFMVQAIRVMLKTVSTQSFTWICAHLIWTAALGRWKLFFMRIRPVSVYYIRYRFFHHPQPANISSLKAFCSDLCWLGLWGKGTCLTFATAFFPNTMARQNIFKQTLFFFSLQNFIDFTFLVPVESVIISFSFAVFMFEW